MDSRSSVFYLGFPLGTWFQTQVRVSLFFPLLVIVCLQRLGLNVGLATAGVLFVSVLIHEFAHVFAARASGGDGDEILIWPLGGLAFTRPAQTASSEFITAAAGPFSNLLMCAASLAALLLMGHKLQADVFSIMTLPPVSMTTTRGIDLLLLMASINFKLMCINLLPAIPLDGGQMALSFAKSRWPTTAAKIVTLKIGQFVSILVALAGLLLQDSFPVFLAFLLMAYNLHEYFLALVSEQLDDPLGNTDFGGYAGYAGMDQEKVKAPGPLARWRQRREEERRQRDETERVETEQRLDLLLDKVHREGINSLSEAEKRFLTRASARYRSHEH